MEHHQELGNQIWLRRKTGQLLAQIRQKRPTTSYYTIRSAFSKGPTTPLRKEIIELAQKIISEN